MARSTSDESTTPRSSRSSIFPSRFTTMQLPSVSPRLFALTLLLLSFSMLVYGAPVGLVSPASKDMAARTDGEDALSILLKLFADIQLKLTLLDGDYHDGTNPAGIIADIAALINAAVVLLAALPADLLALSSIYNVAKTIADIIIAIVIQFGKWNDKSDWDRFLTVIVVVDDALKALISVFDGPLGSIIGLLVGLLSSIHLALLVKLKFVLTIAALGV
ncbi:hypothetical protein FRC07_002638 [Ceratobasidium sp. 392]|nr:hypothetical protein FRC07_002638 [Ceratobasidium sp. 392]